MCHYDQYDPATRQQHITGKESTGVTVWRTQREKNGWQIIMFALIRGKSTWVPDQINTREKDKSKASLLKLNANSLKTKLTGQRGRGQ